MYLNENTVTATDTLLCSFCLQLFTYSKLTQQQSKQTCSKKKTNIHHSFTRDHSHLKYLTGMWSAKENLDQLKLNLGRWGKITTHFLPIN